jgi:hypothetical protein
MPNKYKFQGTDLEDYFNTGNSSITGTSFNSFPNYDPSSEDYEKITSNIGYSIGGTDISQLYNIKSKFEEIRGGTSSGTLTIPTWATGIKIYLATKQGPKGNDSAPAAPGVPGANRGPFSPGTPGTPGTPGANTNANGCGRFGSQTRTRNGGAGGAGGLGGAAGLGASGGTGGAGGTGATGGDGGEGVIYKSPNITDLSTIRGNGVSYSISDTSVTLSSNIFNISANRGVSGNNANNPNSGQNGNNATGGSNGQDGQDGQDGANGRSSCSAPGTSPAGLAGTPGTAGNNAIAGTPGASGNNGTNGNTGSSGNVSVTGPSDVNALSNNSNSISENIIKVHFFIE